MSTTITGLYVSAARKVLALIPATPRVVTLPEGAVWSKYRTEGKTNPAIVVCNATEVNKGETPNGTFQGGRVGEFVLVNEVSEDAANAFLSTIGENYSIEELEAALKTLASKGFTDQYTTDAAFVSDKLSPAGLCFGSKTKPDGKFETVTAGFVKRDDRDQLVVFRGDDEVLYVVHKGGEKSITDEIFERTYRNPNGSPVDAKKVPAKVS